MGKLYTIKLGDVLSQIALDNNTSEDEIMKRNPKIINRHEIKAYDVIILPTMEDNRLPDGTFIGRRIDWTPPAKSTSSPTNNTNDFCNSVSPCSLTNSDNNEKEKDKCENIIFIGSELHYKSFWLQMMFIGAATCQINKGLREADRTIIACVEYGYNDLELGAIKLYCEKFKYEYFILKDNASLISLMNRERDKTKIKDVYFFCHGTPYHISLNYSGVENILISADTINKIEKNIFLANGNIYSYACQTGNPQSSLAQTIANYFKVNVYAFLRRTFYGNVLRGEENSSDLSKCLREKRKESEGNVIDILNSHKALPHKGLSNTLRAKMEGTNDYSLWRKQGGLEIPTAGKTPKEFNSSMQQFIHKGT
ncbi:LysM peptidoglycan-binding domain-containing protein [Desulfomicrobium salsuginis]